MKTHRLLDYYRPSSAGDGNVGGGYGTISSKGLGSEYSRESTYPYRMSSFADDEEFDEDLDSFVEDEMSGDSNLLNRLSNKINRSIGTSDPVRGNRRADRASFVSGQRLDLAETPSIPMRGGDSTYGSMSPIPFKAMYKGFSGPAVGGTSNSFAYKTGPGRKPGTPPGTSRAPLATVDDEIRVSSLNDIPDSSVRAILKARNNIKKVLSERNF